MITKSWMINEWQKTKEQLSENNRLRWACWCVILIFLLWINLLLSDSRGELKESLSKQYSEWNDQQSLVGESQWPERLSQARKAIDVQGKRFGMASSESLARADIQTFAAAEAKRHQLGNVSIEVSSAAKVQADSGLIPLQLRLSGQGAANRVLAMINGLEQHTPSYRVDSTNVQLLNEDLVGYNIIATVWYFPWKVEQ